MKRHHHCMALALLPSLLSPAIWAQGNSSSALGEASFPSWINPAVAVAWKHGYTGSGSTITVIDAFGEFPSLIGNLGDGLHMLNRGQWAFKASSMIAPAATHYTMEYSRDGHPIAPGPGMNILNVSYGIMLKAETWPSQIHWGNQQESIFWLTQKGQVVVVKAAGNDGINIGQPNTAGYVDFMNEALRNKAGVIFAGALNSHGNIAAPSTLASYSNRPGNDPALQQHFLVVALDKSKTAGLAGTEIAAPILSAYAAIVESKFPRSTPTQIVERLLSTARQDSISGYDAKLHGRGEASITRALAPKTVH